jgi:hypothetical protein
MEVSVNNHVLRWNRVGPWGSHFALREAAATTSETSAIYPISKSAASPLYKTDISNNQLSKSQIVQESCCCCCCRPRHVPTRNMRKFTIPSVIHHRQNSLEYTFTMLCCFPRHCPSPQRVSAVNAVCKSTDIFRNSGLNIYSLHYFFFLCPVLSCCCCLYSCSLCN